MALVSKFHSSNNPPGPAAARAPDSAAFSHATFADRAGRASCSASKAIFAISPAATASPAVVSQVLPVRIWSQCYPQCSQISSRRSLCPVAATFAPHGAASTTPTTAAPEPASDVQLRVKLGMAASSDRLDLSNCGLQSVPEAVWELTNLEALSLHGNPLGELSYDLGRLTNLQRLQISACNLQQVPASISSLINLEGLWMHGNAVTELPAAVGNLTNLRTLIVSSNCLTQLPDSITALDLLSELGVAGNQLESLPAGLGALRSLKKLALNGNNLHSLPSSIGGLCGLQELSLQSNCLRHLPIEISRLKGLIQLNLAENKLSTFPVPQSIGEQIAWPVLKELWIYSNNLKILPSQLLSSCPSLRNLWLEDNPLSAASLDHLLQLDPSTSSVKAIGIDERQVSAVGALQRQNFNPAIRIAKICAISPGYWKMDPGPHLPLDASIVAGRRVLVVTFASAPGTPNWGNLLGRLRQSADQPAHNNFDILYVVDAARMWYEGGGPRYMDWHAKLKSITDQYSRVIFLGDSMGATGALLFSDLATAVHAFSPQVELNTASLRPACDKLWADILKMRLLTAVGNSAASITIHSSNWSCDLDQARLIPADRATLHVYNVDSHRLALYMDGAQLLLPTIKKTLVQQMGLPDAAEGAVLLTAQIKQGPHRIP